MRFSDYLKNYKRDHSLTMPDMCKMTGIPYNTMSHHFYTGNIPQPAIFAKYGVLFGTSDGQLLKSIYDYFWDEERAYRMSKEGGKNEDE